MYPAYFEQSFNILNSWLLKILNRKELYFKNIGLFLGWSITEDQLEKVAKLSGVLADNDDYLPADLRAKCEQAMPDIPCSWMLVILPMHLGSSRRT